MTVYTIAFNNYGEFISKWLDNIRKQTIVPKVVIVLGKNAGISKEQILSMGEDLDIKVIKSKSSNMGYLRNKAVEVIDTEWSLYFSVDDTLLPHAVEEILQSDKQVVALKFIDKQTSGKQIERNSAIFTKDTKQNWKKNYIVPGYVAVKGKYYYEEIEIPNYPFMFQLCELGQEHSKTVCAIYERREQSHGFKSSRNGRFKDFTKMIDDYARR